MDHTGTVTIKQTWSRSSIILEASEPRTRSILVGLATEKSRMRNKPSQVPPGLGFSDAA
jgi:hypothetical protein